jgi:REP element-mobilizing transposase RayT
MSVGRTHTETNTTYFITFTCHEWMALIQETNLYDNIYKWFDIIKKDNNHILGYVIMPNHLHMLIHFTQTDSTINDLIAEGKKFRAWEIVKRLEQQKKIDILKILQDAVTDIEKEKGQKHKVFIDSFDCKECYSAEFIQQKLNYMHFNPLTKHWHLADEPENYIHASAKFYMTGEQGIYPVTDYLEFYDVPVAKKMY